MVQGLKAKKVCILFLRFAESNEFYSTIEASPLELIPHLPSTDLKTHFTNFDSFDISSSRFLGASKLFWDKSLKSTIVRAIGKEITKSESESTTLFTKFSHSNIHSDKEICPVFSNLQKYSTKEQVGRGIVALFATLKNSQMQEKLQQTLYEIRRLGGSTTLDMISNPEFIQILSKQLFTDPFQVCTHGLTAKVSGLHNKQYEQGIRPGSFVLDGKKHQWTKHPNYVGWEIKLEYDYSGKNELFLLHIELHDSVIEIRMKEIQVGYQLNNEQYKKFKKDLLQILSSSINVEVLDSQIEIVQYDLNQDILMLTIIQEVPDLIDNLRADNPEGKIYRRFDLSGIYEGAYIQIYPKTKEVDGQLVEYLRFEIAVRSKKAVKGIEKDDTILGAMKQSFIDTSKLASKYGKGFSDIFEDKSAFPLLKIMDNIANFKDDTNRSVNIIKELVVMGDRNIAGTTIANSKILARNTQQTQEIVKQFGVLQEQLVLVENSGIQSGEIKTTLEGFSSNLEKELSGLTLTVDKLLPQMADAITLLTEENSTNKELIERNLTVMEKLVDNQDRSIRIEDYLEFEINYTLDKPELLPTFPATVNIRERRLAKEREEPESIVVLALIGYLTNNNNWHSSTQLRKNVTIDGSTIRNLRLQLAIRYCRAAGILNQKKQGRATLYLLDEVNK